MRSSLFNFLFREGHRELPTGIYYYIFITFALVISAFTLWLGGIGNMSPYHYSVIFVGFILPLAFLTTRGTKKIRKNPSAFDLTSAFLFFLACMYIVWNMDYFLTRVSGLDSLSALQMIAGLIILIGVLELCRRTLGFGLTSILVIGLLYAYVGHVLPGRFGHRELSNERILEELIFTTNGVFGAPVQVAATYAFLFITFGYFFKKSGAGQFIIDFCAALVGRRVGGLAKVSVTTSAAFGSISGSPTADVAATGSITIPNMKAKGYQPEYAAAVEASASSGGTILPPIMGSVAFLMAEFTGISYFEIIVASLLSAILYYLGVYFQVHFRSVKLGMVGMPKSEIPNLFKTIRAGYFYAFPVIILVWAMEQGYTPSLAATYGIIATFLISFIKKTTRISFRDIKEIFTDVVYHIAPLTVATAAAGIIIGVINLTGLAGKFTSLIFTVTGEAIFLSLIVGAFICIILGMGMPTPSAYVLVATLVAPALLQLGLPLLQTHLFLLFFCALSAITPPVGVASFTAAGIANANPLTVGVQATKLASVGFILPFMFVYHPSLLMQGSVWQISITALTAVVGVYALAASMEGYLRVKLKWVERAFLFLVALSMIYPNLILNLITAAIFVLYIFRYHWKVPASFTEEKVGTEQPNTL
ncbi:TRAP transporter permease [Halalkalibacterium ligniniphilum]|uniref:TRAP transporter permease n=1 Tax=Halalkalibacterium ligniniphilum TaxID=1134413 RepID=UPI00034810D1|nr:TRAP transporter fused permease subunit [Halalkalibacterium ligniniphilum]